MAEDRVTGQKMRVTLTWEDDPNQIITFDATKTENHASNSEITDYPIEEGANPSDHIRKMPDELGLSSIVSDDPLVVDRANAPPASTGEDTNQRAISAYAFLRRSQDEGKLIRVFTKLREYRNMAIESLNVTRDASSSRILDGDIQLREIFVAVTERVTAPIPIATAAPARRGKRKQGKKTKTDETEANSKGLRSTASKWLGGGLTGFLEGGPGS